MAFKNFRTICIARVSLLFATICLFSYLIFQMHYYATILIIGALIIYQTFALIRYVEKTNLDLTRFLEAVRNEDFTQSFTGAGLGNSFNLLRTAYNEVLHVLQQARSEREEHYRYLQTVVQHVGVGLICFRPNGKVELINTAALRLLKSARLKNINELESFSKDLVDNMLRLKAGEKEMVKVEHNGETLHLAIYATELRMRGHTYTLVSIQNIQSELEEKEMEAWQNLVRVLTHEIMNSITPISSLASTANDLLKPAAASGAHSLGGKIRPEAIRDIHEAVQTIEKRSEGLLHFVDNYRKITRIPKPNFQIVPVAELFERVNNLLRAQMDEAKIEVSIHMEQETLELTADPELVEQVLINLLLNAIQALESQADARIELNAKMDGSGRPLIQVKDNGPGILEEVQEKIFIPFFTTRQEGSGIGLSLARQIMRLHRSTISVQSKPNVETIFTLKF
ncbi:PAS domain-containing sensor histidine kinase [Gemmatimonadota bacterium]